MPVGVLSDEIQVWWTQHLLNQSRRQVRRLERNREAILDAFSRPKGALTSEEQRLVQEFTEVAGPEAADQLYSIAGGAQLEQREEAESQRDAARFFNYLRDHEPALFEQLNDEQRGIADAWAYTEFCWKVLSDAADKGFFPMDEYSGDIEKQARDVTFRVAYWSRAEELIPFMTPEAQRQVVETASNSGFDADEVASMCRAAAQRSGDLDLDEANRTLQDFAWAMGTKTFNFSELFLLIAQKHDQLATEAFHDFYDLTVTLRREVESLVIAESSDEGRADELRDLIESKTRRLAAELDAHQDDDYPEYMPTVEPIREKFDEVRSELNHLLGLAGARPSE